MTFDQESEKLFQAFSELHEKIADCNASNLKRALKEQAAYIANEKIERSVLNAYENLFKKALKLLDSGEFELIKDSRSIVYPETESAHQNHSFRIKEILLDDDMQYKAEDGQTGEQALEAIKSANLTWQETVDQPVLAFLSDCLKRLPSGECTPWSPLAKINTEDLLIDTLASEYKKAAFEQKPLLPNHIAYLVEHYIGLIGQANQYKASPQLLWRSSLSALLQLALDERKAKRSQARRLKIPFNWLAKVASHSQDEADRGTVALIYQAINFIDLFALMERQVFTRNPDSSFIRRAEFSKLIEREEGSGFLSRLIECFNGKAVIGKELNQSSKCCNFARQFISMSKGSSFFSIINQVKPLALTPDEDIQSIELELKCYMPDSFESKLEFGVLAKEAFQSKAWLLEFSKRFFKGSPSGLPLYFDEVSIKSQPSRFALVTEKNEVTEGFLTLFNSLLDIRKSRLSRPEQVQLDVQVAWLEICTSSLSLKPYASKNCFFLSYNPELTGVDLTVAVDILDAAHQAAFDCPLTLFKKEIE